MKFNYSKLRGKIRELYHTETAFARELEISRVSMSAKLSGHVAFTQEEILKSAKLLNIPDESFHDFFFSPIS